METEELNTEFHLRLCLLNLSEIWDGVESQRILMDFGYCWISYSSLHMCLCLGLGWLLDTFGMALQQDQCKHIKMRRCSSDR